MLEQAILLKLSSQNLAESTTSQLRQEYQAFQRLFQAQPALDQEYLRNQAAYLAEAIMNGRPPIRFSLPEHVVCLPMMDCLGVEEKLPHQAREQRIGSWLDHLTHTDLSKVLGRRLSELEELNIPAVSVSAGLMRYAVAVYMIYQMLPAGKAVVYATPEDDDIPNQPVHKNIIREIERKTHLVNQPSEKLSVEDDKVVSAENGYAHGFFMPQQVALDEQSQLLVSDQQVAIDAIEALRRYLCILNTALGLAHYMVVDEQFQAKRYGIMGQLVNQGRALASYQVELICQTIKQQADSHRLDRGLRLSLPYFNDETMRMELYNFDVIPAGLVLFVPAFVVLAVRAQAAKVVNDTRLNRTTRRNLLQGLCILEKAFLRS